MLMKQNVELIRIVSTFGIVWYHSSIGGSDYFYSALVIFVFLSSYLSGTRSPEAIGTRTYKRFQRLLVPWLVWFCVYAFANHARHKPVIPVGNGWFSGILSGPSDHLWYLPFMFVNLFLLDGAKRTFAANHIGLIAAVVSIALLFATPMWRNFSLGLGYPYAQYFHAAPAFLMGVWMLYCKKFSTQTQVIIFACLLAASLSVLHVDGVGLPYTIGTAVAIVLLYSKDFQTHGVDLTAWSSVTFGIYLCHKIFLGLLNQLLRIEGPWLPICAFLISGIFIKVLRTAFPAQAKWWS